MYSSRGIGRHSQGERRYTDRHNDKYSDKYKEKGHTPEYSYGPASPDANSQMADRDIEKKSRYHDDRRDYKDFKKSPNYENSHNSSSRDGYTPPGPPPTPGPTNDRQTDKPAYVPTSSLTKPLQPVYSPNDTPIQNSPYSSTPRQDVDSNRPPTYNKVSNYPPTNPTPVPYRPPATSTSNPLSGRYGPDPFAQNEQAETQKEAEERIWQQKCAQLFAGVGSIEELIDLKEQYANKAQSLDGILQKSHLREGEILRNKRRDRDGFKDPMMLELRKMQEDIKKKLEEVNKFRVEIDKKIRAFNKAIQSSQDPYNLSASHDKPSNYEAQLLQNSLISSTDDNDEEDEEDEYEYENSTKEYYDPGSHWCRDCDKMVSKLDEYFEHLHTKDHWKVAHTDVKPWKKAKRQAYPNASKQPAVKTKTAIKGVQFLIPLRGFYCPLCKDYLADNTMAEEHMRGAKHNRIYNRFLCVNLDYEHKWSTDKGKALARHQNNERKRIKEEEQKEAERKKKLEEQKAKEEKEAKKKRKEEEAKRKEKEEREREKEREEYKRNKKEKENQSERFRIKGVVMSLKDEKPLFSFTKDKDRSRDKERDKHKKRTRVYSSSSNSSASSSPPRKKKQTYFGDPYKDPKLKKKTFVKLMPLNKKIARKYNCDQLLSVLEEAKKKKESDRGRDNEETKPESKTVITIANSPVKMDIDINQEEENDNKDLRCVVDGILETLEDLPDKDVTNDRKEQQRGETADQENNEESDTETKKCKADGDKHLKRNNESESDSNLQIDLNQENDNDERVSKPEDEEPKQCKD